MSEQIRGAGQPAWPLSPYEVQVSYGASGGIARGTGADWFGPLDPLRPIAPPDVAGRRFDFPPGYNLVTRPRAYEPVGFAELRAFADAYDLLRLVIETRKDQMERQRWRIRPRDPKLKRKSASVDADFSARIAADRQVADLHPFRQLVDIACRMGEGIGGEPIGHRIRLFDRLVERFARG